MVSKPLSLSLKALYNLDFTSINYLFFFLPHFLPDFHTINYIIASIPLDPAISSINESFFIIYLVHFYLSFKTWLKYHILWETCLNFYSLPNESLPSLFHQGYRMCFQYGAYHIVRNYLFPRASHPPAWESQMAGITLIHLWTLPPKEVHTECVGNRCKPTAWIHHLINQCLAQRAPWTDRAISKSLQHQSHWGLPVISGKDLYPCNGVSG